VQTYRKHLTTPDDSVHTLLLTG